MNIAIIPARGGSKRIPRKNVRNFCGKPMLAWPIEAAKDSNLFGEILVSTDDEEIAEIATAYGAITPFIRPPELSNDHAGTAEVVVHALNWGRQQGWRVEAACCIYATAPFVTVNDLVRGLHVLRSSQCTYAFSVTDYPASIFRSFEPLREQGVRMVFPEMYHKRSQDLPTVWHDAGQFYWALPHTWLTDSCVFSKNSAPVFIPRWRVQDIDTPDDWRRAELIFNIMKSQFNG
ncbi:MAG TPA: pseudaminic acid cytidylyltransferase [Burkholderiaceae bacterium]|nr:pseudaminic acid cytidylyltransferase [Burkholderiaceae bacterium]